MSDIEHPGNSEHELLGISVDKDVLVENSGVEKENDRQDKNFPPRPVFQKENLEDTSMESPDAQNNPRSASVNPQSQTETSSSNATCVTISYDVISGDVVTIMDSVDTKASFEPLSDCPETSQTGFEDQDGDDDDGADNDDNGAGDDNGDDDVEGAADDDGAAADDDNGAGDDNDDGGGSGVMSNPFNAISPSPMPHHKLGFSAKAATPDNPSRPRPDDLTKTDSHSGTNPFHCTKCEEKFPSFRSLKYHFSCSHRETPKHQCHLCKRQFSREGYLIKHLHFHRDKSHKCDKCHKTFQGENKLTKHMTT